MPLPAFIRGLILLLVVFATSTYAASGSAGTTLADTAACALVVQLGYFALVLLMVRNGYSGRRRPALARSRRRTM